MCIFTIGGKNTYLLSILLQIVENPKKWIQVGVDSQTEEFVKKYLENNGDFLSVQGFYNYALKQEISRLESFTDLNKHLLKSIPVTTNGATTKILRTLHNTALKFVTKNGPFNSTSKILCYAARNEILRNSTLAEITIGSSNAKKEIGLGDSKN